jgi:2-C-methyl-D-erythritol 4-phosphate cytidylyltransferase
MEKYAVIVAGGKGVRVGGSVPKQFLELAGKPVLYHSIAAFCEAFPDVHIILVLPEAYLAHGVKLMDDFPDVEDFTVTVGGDTRYDSVVRGLEAVSGGGVVFVHDGARPFVTPALIHRCYEAACNQGVAIPAIPVPDSIRMDVESGTVPVDRAKLHIIQTPQTFLTEFIAAAFGGPNLPEFTDEATVLEAAGIPIALTDGERANFKITTAEDLVLAELLMRNRLEASSSNP